MIAPSAVEVGEEGDRLITATDALLFNPQRNAMSFQVVLRILGAQPKETLILIGGAMQDQLVERMLAEQFGLDLEREGVGGAETETQIILAAQAGG